MVSFDFSRLGDLLTGYGIVDILLPFLLVFTIVYAVLQKTKIVGEGKKNFNVIISLILGLLFVVPHITGSYPLGYDPVNVLNQSLPSISLVAVAAIMLLLLLGIFSTTFSEVAAPIIAIVAIIFVIYIFGSALNVWTGPSDVFGWWTDETTEILLIILVFGVLVWFITRDDKSSKISDGIKGAWKGVSSLFQKTNK